MDMAGTADSFKLKDERLKLPSNFDFQLTAQPIACNSQWKFVEVQV